MQGFFASSTVQSNKPEGTLPKCGACGLYKQCHSPKMVPYGKFRRKVLFIGEAPGENEDEQGRPFVGRSGQFLRDTLEDLDFDLDKDGLVTNALICRPPNNKIDDQKRIDYCRPNLRRVIEENNPRVIVLLGRSALKSTIAPYWKGDVGVLERWVGWKIPLQQHWICPTYHPSFLLREKTPPNLRLLFAGHLEEALKINEAVVSPGYYAVQVEYTEEAVAAQLLRFHLAGGWVAVDYETNCLKPDYPESKIMCCAVSDGQITIAYPWRGRNIDNTKRLLLSPRTKKIASNLKFEDRWTRKHLGGPVANWGWDTMIGAHCLDNRPGICSLKFQAFVLLGLESYNERIEPYLEAHNGHYNRIEEVAIGDLMRYNGMDALLEHRIAMLQRRQLGYED